MLRGISLRSAALGRTQFFAYSSETTTKPVAAASQNEVPEAGNNDEPLWDMENPFGKEKRRCILCENKIQVDYKNTRLLSQFVSNYTGELYDKHITGLCDAQQKRVKAALLIAQNAGLLPYYFKLGKYLRDPKLFDPHHPQRSNPH